ncbi:MAG: cobalamin biosynthesis protein, partial [Pseudomonadota bacterium]
MPERETPAVIALTPGGAALAQQLAALVDGQVFVLNSAADGPSDAPLAVPFDNAAETLRTLFAAGRPIIGVCAAAILIRALAPLILSKRDEPPVIAVNETGSSVVPLLGGHRGANALATRIAKDLGIEAAVTTGGDAALGIALDAPPEGWVIENPEAAKAAMARLLGGASCRIAGFASWMQPLVDAGRVAHQADGTTGDPLVLSVDGCEPLIYRQRRLVVGVGCARGCDPGELIGLVGRTLADNGFAQSEVACVASIDLKTDEAAVHALAHHLKCDAQFYTARALEAERSRLATPSDIVFAEVGCHGVAEGAALHVAGTDAALDVTKQKTANATCAVSIMTGPLRDGARRGRLAVVGIGPGRSAWRTPEVSRLVAEADVLVGYGLYIDLLGPAAAGKDRQDYPLGGEEDRCRAALELAGEGKRVALVCS